MTTNRIKALVEKLEKHPKLLARMEELILIVEGEDEKEIQRADDAEEAVIANLRNFGKELLQEWSSTQEQRLSSKTKEKTPNLKVHSKKNCIGTPHTD
jgi:hypothetical protein